MSIETMGDDPDQDQSLTIEQFRRERLRIWDEMRAAKGPKKPAVTISFLVRSPSAISAGSVIEVIETIGRDIHIYTSSTIASGRRRFGLTASAQDLTGTVEIDTKDMSLAKTVQLELVRKFEETGDFQTSLIWLVEQSKYAAMRGTEDGPLLIFRY